MNSRRDRTVASIARVFHRGDKPADHSGWPAR